MPDNLSAYLGTTAMAVGALGTASYGIVDGMKLFSWVDLAGFEQLFSSDVAGGRTWPSQQTVGLDALLPVLQVAYGSDVMGLLKAQYRNGRAKGDLPRTLRQGVRIGFGMSEQNKIVTAATSLGLADSIASLAAHALELAREQRPPAAGETAKSSQAISEDARAALARLETAIDARIDAALALAETKYVTKIKLWATFVALVIAFGVGLSLDQKPAFCFIVGITAVPLAPVAKDLATALQEAVKAFKGR